MNNVRKLYEKYWMGKTEEFTNYIRNLSLSKFFKKGDFILDVGCGDGAVAEFLQESLGAKVIGIDISKEAVSKALERGVKARVLSSEDKFPFKDNTFDAVFWGDNIEHLFNPLDTGREIKRVLKKGGKLILSCPNMGYLRYRIFYLLNGQLPDTEWTNLPPWQWAHIRFFNLKLLKEFLEWCGFKKIIQIVGVSERRVDKIMLSFFPQYFGMILIVEAQ